MRDTGADTARARAELAFEPRVSFVDGLRAQFDWAAASAAHGTLTR